MFNNDKDSFNKLAASVSDLDAKFSKITKQLQEEITSKVSDDEKSAKQSSRKASEFRNKSEIAKNSSLDSEKIISELQVSASDNADKIADNMAAVEDINRKASLLLEESTQSFEYINTSRSKAEQKTADLMSILEKCEDLPEKVSSQLEQLSEIEKIYTQIKAAHNQAFKKKSEIDEMYDEIFGYEVESEEDDTEPELIEGLKKQLENSYSELKFNLSELSSDVEVSKSEMEESYFSALNNLTEKFDGFITQSQGRFDVTHDEIKGLLPNALTAGLSHAYEAKKNEEISSQDKLKSDFNNAIYGLVGISLIPFCVDIYLLIGGADLLKVIKDTPNLLISILPIYFPVLWLAYSSNKKLNLSKRLIEEYTHKEVLSKTYEGLSTQIDSVSQSHASDELKTKLLFNILEISSENPGKLISNYDKSDHPLMDALETSAKLANSVEKLAKIPGFSKIAKNLDEKANKVLSTADKRVSAALDVDLEEMPETPSAREKAKAEG